MKVHYDIVSITFHHNFGVYFKIILLRISSRVCIFTSVDGGKISTCIKENHMHERKSPS